MQNLSLESTHLSVDPNRLVYVHPAPTPPTAVEETELMVRIPSGTAEEASEVETDPRNTVSDGLKARFLQGTDLVRQNVAYTFIGVQREDPVMRSLLEGEILLLYIGCEAMFGGSGAP
jgi:hypothetical protein